MCSTEEKLKNLLDAFNSYKESKNNDNYADGSASFLKKKRQLLDAYMSYNSTSPSHESSRSDDDLLEAALNFCQQQKTTSLKPAANELGFAFASVGSSRGNTAFKQLPFEKLSEENLDAEREVRELSIKEKSPTRQIVPKEIKVASFTRPALTPPKGQITIVESDGKKYTRIAPPASDKQRTFAPSPDSAFRPTLQLDGKRLRLDPGLQHLQDLNKNKLIRSTSVPASYPGAAEGNPALHRMLYRTGSFVSDLTKQKLKNSILARTSAALVRKPSITDQEMMQIRNSEGSDDSDSSVSDSDNETIEEPSGSRKRKYSDEIIAITNSALMPQLLPVVITTTGPS